MIKIQKEKYYSQLKWLEQQGIKEVPNIYGNLDLWKLMSDLSFVKLLPSGYVMSNEFYLTVSKKIDQKGIVTLSVLSQFCQQSASEFKKNYLSPLITFLEDQSKLFYSRSYSGTIFYLASHVVDKCELLFFREGAATRNEFAETCKKVANLYGYPKENWTLSDFTIARLLSKKELEKVKLLDQNDYLYVVKRQRSYSKVIKKEINLDD